MSPHSSALRRAFVDQASVLVHSGRGGTGCQSFYRDKWTRHPVPDGGDGGRGGHVLIRANPQLTTLLDFQTRRHFRGAPGGHASSNKKHGQNGKDCILEVPSGTLVRDAETGDLIRELINPEESVIVARGGSGGRGNASLKRGNLQRKKPLSDEVKMERRAGQPGIKRALQLELKLLADVGIIGMPNAGKSTLIAQVSEARPKAAAFPFTTTAPVLGVVQTRQDQRFVAVDVPGLIEGANEGRGLGLEFLRHIERTHLLVHLIDMAGTDGRDPVDDFRNLNKELKAYKTNVADKPQILVANKMDCEGSEEHLKDFRERVKQEPIPISAKNGEGVDRLLKTIAGELEKIKA